MRLIDAENNQITDHFVPKNVQVLNVKGNFISSAKLKVKVVNPMSLREYSSFEKFGSLAFGQPCKPKPIKRHIRIAMMVENSTSRSDFGTPDNSLTNMQKKIIAINTSESEKSLQLKNSMLDFKKRKSHPSSSCNTNQLQNYYENSLNDMDLSKIKSLST